jgi:lysophospholipase L1-like esterase
MNKIITIIVVVIIIAAVVQIVNIHDFGWDKFPDLSVTYAADNFHPNDDGYQNWANAFLEKIQE